MLNIYNFVVFQQNRMLLGS